MKTEQRSNRTFMELKLTTDYKDITDDEGSNRTFMELKCGKITLDAKGGLVLIVPLWN